MFQRKFFSSKNVVKGFTLVEIIVVLVILAILAAATIPSMLGFIDEAKFKTIDNEARVVRNAAQAYATEYSAKGETDEDIASAINGVINSNHALHNLLQNDANGTVFMTEVKNGKIKKFNYTKEIINQDEDVITDKIRYAVFDDTKSSLLHATGSVTTIDIDDFKTKMKADLIEELTSNLTSSLSSSLAADMADMKTDLQDDLTSDLTSSLTTTLNSNLESGMNSKISALKTNFRTELGSNVVDLIYPVGSFYVSYSPTSPATLFGGTWTQITDRFLYCANSSGQTGGSTTHSHGLADTGYACAFISTTGKLSARCAGLSSLGLSWNCSRYSNGSGGDGSGDVPYGVSLIGTTNSATSMPPYMTVYCWRRTV